MLTGMIRATWPIRLDKRNGYKRNALMGRSVADVHALTRALRPTPFEPSTFFLSIFVALCLLSLSACSIFSGTSAKQAVAQVDWSFASDAILIEIHADDLLNRYDTQPHTILLGVFQTADADSFRKFAADPAAMAKALADSLPDPSVLKAVRYVVQPGRHTILSIDRAAKAKVVGLIAGYYTMDVKTSARLFEIPLAISNDATFGHNYVAQPQTLALRLALGPSEIASATRLNPEPPEIVAAQKRAQETSQVIPLDGGGHEILLTPASGNDAAGAAAIQLPN
jgi:type VI secretion system VasD/TssJ family lipoprotein